MIEDVTFGIKEDYNKVTSYNEIIKLEKNPFLIELKLKSERVYKGFKAGEVVIPEDGGISKEESIRLTEENTELQKVDLSIAKVRYKQKANFILIYTTPLLNYRDLSEASLKILMFMFEKKVGLGLDYLVMGVAELCTELRMSRPTITKGLVELVRNKLIAKREDSVWWINPNYFYAGNRQNINSK